MQELPFEEQVIEAASAGCEAIHQSVSVLSENATVEIGAVFVQAFFQKLVLLNPGLTVRDLDAALNPKDRG